MATTNKGLTQPPIGSPNWAPPLNDDFGDIDQAFGGVTSINVTGVTATPVVMTLDQYQSLTIKFSGTLTANVTYQLPAGVGGRWVVQNNTTGAFSITMASLGGGPTFAATAGYTNFISDGTGCYGRFGGTPTGIIAIWSGSVATIPTGWLLCDGTNGTLNLRDKFIVGAGSTYAVGDTGGVDTVTLSVAQMPSHTHTVAGTTAADGIHTHFVNDPSHAHGIQQLWLNGGADAGSPGVSGAGSASGFTATTVSSGTGISIVTGGAHQHSYSGTTTSIGGGTAHENRPPYFALCYIQKI
jgi:microcystin-dependent protein